MHQDIEFLTDQALLAPRKLGFKQRLQVLFALFAASALGACGGSDGANSAAGPGPGPGMGQQVARVKTVTMAPTTISTQTTLPGRARAYTEAEIRPQVTGLIEARLFEEGDEVTAGQPLYRIDQTEYQAAVRQAKASLQRAQAVAETARQTEKRFSELADINAVSRQNYDERVAARKQAEADVAMQRAALERAQINLDRTLIAAPIDGRIGRSSVTAGALVTQNQAAALSRVVRIDPIYVDMTASSTELLRYRRDVMTGRVTSDEAGGGVSVEIINEDGSLHPQQGTLEFSELSVDPDSGSVVVRAVVPNPNGLLLPGMFVQGRFAAGSYENVFTVPQRAVSRTPRGDAQAMVVNAENVVEPRPLQVIEARDNMYIVEKGLVAGDRVIVSGLQAARPGVVADIIDDGSQPGRSAAAILEESAALAP